MSTSAATAEAVLEAAAAAGNVRVRKMFGEYAVYLDEKVVALICDDILFLKATPGAVACLPGAETGLPYPGAKPHLVGTELLDSPDTLVDALRAIWNDLPTPKPRKRS